MVFKVHIGTQYIHTEIISKVIKIDTVFRDSKKYVTIQIYNYIDHY